MSGKNKYRPGSGKKYDPNDPHFNPMHPPEGYPADLLKAEWEEPEITPFELEDGRTGLILERKTRDD